MKISTSILLRDLLAKKRSFVEELAAINLFKNASPKTVFSSLKNSGVDGIELLLIKEASQDDLCHAKAILEECDMPVLSIHQPLRFLSTTTLNDLKELFKCAAMFNVKVITLHLAMAGKLVFDDAYKKGLHKLEKKYNILVGYENSQKHIIRLGKSYLWKEPAFFDFIANMGFHVTFDTTHFGTAGINIVDTFNKNKDKIVNIHIGDYKNHAFSSSFRPLAYTHLPLGTGSLPIKEFLTILKKENYKGLITMEIDHVDYQELCKNAEYIKKIVK